MPGSTPPTSQLDWLISTTAMIVLSWSRATRDLLKSFGWGIGALHRLATATMVPSPRRLPHSISRSRCKNKSHFREAPRGFPHPAGRRREHDGLKRSEVDEFAVRALETQREGVFSAAVYENIRLDQREIEQID